MLQGPTFPIRVKNNAHAKKERKEKPNVREENSGKREKKAEKTGKLFENRKRITIDKTT